MSAKSLWNKLQDLFERKTAFLLSGVHPVIKRKSSLRISTQSNFAPNHPEILFLHQKVGSSRRRKIPTRVGNEKGDKKKEIETDLAERL